MKKQINVELFYPRVEGNPDCIQIELSDVRAAIGFSVKYDFDRDGWSILRDTVFEWEDNICDGKPVEVAFLPAWPEGSKE